MKKFRFALIAPALVALALAACAMPDPATTPDLSLAGVQPVRLNVAAIEIAEAYRAPMGPPNVDHLFKTPPAAATRALLGHALVAAGPMNTLRAVIEDASVVNEDLPVDNSALGKFKREPSNIYRARVAVRFELFDPAAPDIVLGRAEVTATRNRTLMKGDTLAERDRAAYEMTRDLMQDVASGINTIVKNTFGAL